MDPLTAAGLAGTVVQFISFAHEIISIGKEIYKSSNGARNESVELALVIRDLSKIHDSLRCFWSGDAKERSKQEQTLFSLIEQCDTVYKELLRILEKPQVQGDHRKWNSFCAALKFVWKEDQINDLEKRLLRLQRQIDSHLISDIRYELISSQEEPHKLTEW